MFPIEAHACVDEVVPDDAIVLIPRLIIQTVRHKIPGEDEAIRSFDVEKRFVA